MQILPMGGNGSVDRPRNLVRTMGTLRASSLTGGDSLARTPRKAGEQLSRWEIGDNALTTLSQNTGNTGDELSSLIQQLVQAAEPLAGKFDGAGKAAFDSFKARADGITADLRAGLGSIQEGQTGMNTAFTTGAQTMADDASQNMGAANFDAAKFR